MSTLKVDNIQSYAGGDVTLNGNLDVTGVISGDGSGLTNVPGGGSDLSSYTGSINQTGGNITLDGDFNLSTNGGAQSVVLTGGGLTVDGFFTNLNGGVNIPNNKALNVALSGSGEQYSVGGFFFDGKSFGNIYSTATGGFQIVDGAAAGVGSSVTIQSDNGNVNLRTENAAGGVFTNTAGGAILNTIGGSNIWRAQQSNYQLTLYGGGIGVTRAAGYTGSVFAGNIDSTYGFNIYNQADFSQDTGLALDMTTAGAPINKIGIYSNHGAPGVQSVMSWQDSNNYTDGALQVHQILKVDGSNNAPATQE